LLIAGGLVLLAQNLGLFGELAAPVWSFLFGLAALAFFGAYFSDRSAWWFLIPGFVLAGLALTVLVTESGVDDRFRGDLGGSVFLWSIGLAFWAVYAADNRQWWAIIPAGVMTTLGLMPLVADQVAGTSTGAILFLGLGLTFGLLYLLRGRHATGWAIFPAGGCLAMALILGVFGPLERFWPVIFLILPGVYLLYQALRPRRGAGPKAEGGPTA
jgi:hypothetical protein